MEPTLYGGQSNKGCAYCKLHHVYLTYKQLKQKQCLFKQCWHLERVEDHPVWKQREWQKNKRKERKALLYGHLDNTKL